MTPKLLLLAYLHLQIMIHNLHIRSRIYQFPVEGETAEDALVREANSNACIAEARRQEERWTTTYEGRISQATDEVDRAKGEAKVRAQEQLEYLREVCADPPRCGIADLNSLTTIGAATAAIRPRFTALDTASRLQIWGSVGRNQPAHRKNLTLSHIASVLKDSQKVVDLRQVPQFAFCG
jgi:hypothetical protein